MLLFFVSLKNFFGAILGLSFCLRVIFLVLFVLKKHQKNSARKFSALALK